MGCEQSKCLQGNKGEVEVKINTENITTQNSSPKKSTRFVFRDYGTSYTAVKPKESGLHSNPKLTCSAEPESTKNTKIDMSAVKHLSSNLCNSSLTKSGFGSTYKDLTIRQLYPTISTELNITIGKAIDQLEAEFFTIEKTINRLLTQQQQIPLTVSESVRIKVGRWYANVYADICKKTTEIRNSLAYNFSLNGFAIMHEITAWDDLPLLTKFCMDNGLPFDSDMVAEYEKRMKNMAALTVVVTLEINLLENGSKIEYNVTIALNKPFNYTILKKILSENCESENLGMWYEAHQPLGSDFGFNINSKDNTKEMLLGFYIFDGSGRMNLRKALSAYQSYGAEFTPEKIAALKKIACEELKVFFSINENGVAKIRMLLYHLSDELLETILESFPQTNCQFDKVKAIRQYISDRDMIEDRGAFVYFLDFSVDGFKLGCQTRIGKEHGSFVYIDTVQ